MSDHWTTIESDPGVFTELISSFGVQGVQVEEVTSLEQESLAALEPIYGLIFLFKYQGKDSTGAEHLQDPDPALFFAKQVVDNACATQALLSVLLNRPELEKMKQLGALLTNFKSFVSDLPADMKGLAIGNSEEIRRAHNSFARPDPLVPDENLAGQDQDAFHFVTYVPLHGQLYELDGLQPGPISHGAVGTGSAWLAQATEAIKRRVSKYEAGEVHFNLMAVVQDRRVALQKQIEALGADAASVVLADLRIKLAKVAASISLCVLLVDLTAASCGLGRVRRSASRVLRVSPARTPHIQLQEGPC
ncbi:unnamed protein product [Pedinophyceae sp. YPF-701]|nr:unnamed protein product [Pedinophyceae sp. YPF-701]